MLISMTGYGAGSAVRGGVTAAVELRSVNNRFYEFSARLPKRLQPREPELKELVRKAVGRGKISVSVSLETGDSGPVPVSVNVDAARAYHSILTTLRESVGLTSEISLETLLRFSDVLTVEENGSITEDEWGAVTEALQVALGMFTEMRRNEGVELTRDLRARIALMSAAMDEIEQLNVGRAEIERQRLRERVAQLLDSDRIDPARLELEIVLLADKMDITEELVRFRSHVKFFLEALDAEESEGRKLSFLLQEMNREANTVGSKSYDASIAHLVVRVKEELERIREQIQNVE